jgi:triosephosphate isomerase (TIM)
VTRAPLLAANWKMHKTAGEAEEFVAALLPHLSGARADVAVCAPFTALAAVVDSARGSALQVLAQNVHEAEQGAYTGEVSIPMLADLGVQGAIVGHSERRQHFCETDRALSLKVPALLAASLLPLLCVGETEEERAAHETERKLRHQVQEDLAAVEDGRLADVVIAYEPIWAIGTGNVATPAQAQEAIAFIRALVRDRDPSAGDAIRILYGGSVSPDNAAELLALPDVDGALVGGASLDADSFAAIVASAPA